MIHYERCGCNAAILAWSKSALKDWRENHRHDGPPLELVIEETNSAHELAMGFAAEPANGWYDDKVINAT